MAKALNVGVTAWSPLAGGVLTGKYHGQNHGSSEPGRMNNDMLKDFKPEQQRADRVVARQEGFRPNGSQHGAGRSGLAEVSTVP